MRRIVGLVCALACALSGASMTCAFAESSALPSTPPRSPDVNSSEFRPDSDGEAHRIVIATSFLLVLALAAAGTIFYAKRGAPFRFIKTGADDSPIEVLSVKRVTPRLTLVKVRLDDHRTVVIADNGTHLAVVTDSSGKASTNNADV